MSPQGPLNRPEYGFKKVSIAAMEAKLSPSMPAAAVPAEASGTLLAPRQRQNNNGQGSEEVEIRLPRPDNGRLFYTQQEAANILYNLLERADPKRAPHARRRRTRSLCEQ